MPSCLTSSKETQCLLYRKLVGLQCQSGQVQKNLAPTGIQTLADLGCNKLLYCLHYPNPRLKPRCILNVRCDSIKHKIGVVSTQTLQFIFVYISVFILWNRNTNNKLQK